VPGGHFWESSSINPTYGCSCPEMWQCTFPVQSVTKILLLKYFHEVNFFFFYISVIFKKTDNEKPMLATVYVNRFASLSELYLIYLNSKAVSIIFEICGALWLELIDPSTKMRSQTQLCKSGEEENATKYWASTHLWRMQQTISVCCTCTLQNLSTTAMQTPELAF